MKKIKPIILGCSGTFLSNLEKELFSQENPFGLILFDRNINNPKQVKQLISDFRTCVGRPDAPVLIDQEGGHVQRLWPPYWTGLPYSITYGDWYKTAPKKSITAVKKHVNTLAKELLSLGINVDCWPILDIRTEDTYEVMRKRCFSEDPVTVSILAKEVVKQSLHKGLMPIIKHIPGYGRAKVNPHTFLPTIQSDLSTLIKTDFYPFKKLEIPVWGMVAHALYTALDSHLPATLSPTVIRYIRKNIAFKGLLISDDITMGALSSFGTPIELAIQSLSAGCDIVLYSQASIEETTHLIKSLPSLSSMAKKRIQLAQEMLCLKI